MVNPLLAALRDNGILRYQPARLPPHPLTANAFYMGGLLDAFLAENSAAVQREYQLSQASGVGVAFDERLFVERPEQLGSPTRVSAPTAYYYGGVVRQTQLAHWTAPAAAATATTATAADADQRRAKHHSVADANGVECERRKRTATGIARDAARRSAGRERATGAAAHTHHELIEGLELHPNARSVFVRKLFYRLLEAMLRAELTRLGRSGRSADFAALLQNEHFERSLLACCVEIVVVAYKMPQVFPYSTRKLALVAVDMYKIIEVVLRREPNMPARIVAHLAGVEESVLESAAWLSDSSIWQQLRDAPLERATVRELCNWSLNDGASSAFSSTAAGIAVIEATPARSLQRPNSRSATPQPRPSRAGAHAATLAPDALSQAAATGGDAHVFVDAAAQSANRRLPGGVVGARARADDARHREAVLRDRHVDQVIMCTIYGVCKVQSRALTFRAIIDAYRLAMPAAPSSVYRDVRISDTQQGDIILFYNTVFIPLMERALLDLHARVVANSVTFGGERPAAAPSRRATATASAAASRHTCRRVEATASSQTASADEPPPRLLASLGGSKLLLSPLVASHAKVIMAPFDSAHENEQRGVSFALGGVSTIADSLREINETISPRARRAPKRLFEAI
jgi:hypothetical protein